MRYVIFILCFLSAQSFAADTYNFYFPEKSKKKEKPSESVVVESEPAPEIQAEVQPLATGPIAKLGRIQVGLMGATFTDVDFWTEARSKKFSVGPSVGFGAMFSQYWGGQAYLSLPMMTDLDAPLMTLGAEVEFYPFNPHYPEVQSIEFAFLGGVSAAVALHEGGLNPYVGARLGLNLNRKFGLDFSGRTNGTYHNIGVGAYLRI